MSRTIATGQITPEEMKGRIDEDERTVVLDIRNRESFEEWHVPGARHLGYDERLGTFETDPREVLPGDSHVVVVCAHGNTSRLAARRLAELGFRTAHLEEGMAGWGTVFDVVDVDLGTDLVFKQVKRVATGCLSYVFGADGEAMIVDPAQHTDVYEQNLATDERFSPDGTRPELKYVAITHIHADHVSGAADLAERYGAELVVGERVLDRTDHPEGAREFRTVADGETLSVGGHDIEVLETPGHTMESVSYLVDGRALLTGDTQFVDGVGRPDLEDGDEGAREHARILYDSIVEQILSLDPGVEIYPGHWGAEDTDPGVPITATVQAVEEMNRAFDTENREAFVESVLRRLSSKPAHHHEIIAINEGDRDCRDPEIELGPNRCAVDADAD